MKVADAIGITGFLHVQEKLGEMLSQMEIARAVFYGSEAMAQKLPSGVWVPGGHGLRALPPADRQDLPPLRGDRADPGRRAASSTRRARPIWRTRRCGRTSTRTCAAAPGVSAEERIALFKLAWDVDRRGLRPAHGPVRALLLRRPDPAHRRVLRAVRQGAAARAGRARARPPRRRSRCRSRPTIPGAPMPYQPGTRGMAGTYAATSLPDSPGGRRP